MESFLSGMRLSALSKVASLAETDFSTMTTTTITPIIGSRHLKRNGDITGIIVSSEGVCVCPERYPYMEEGNVDPVAAWAIKGQWDDRGSEWPDRHCRSGPGRSKPYTNFTP